VPLSVLEAIRDGRWDYEPRAMDDNEYRPTSALPGSDEKKLVLAKRVQQGLPLWHPEDRRTYDDGTGD
jgi:hypothetical protein